MPLIDVTYPQGGLSATALKKLESILWKKALKWEAIEANSASASVAWAYLDERPRQSVSVGGKPITQNIYRINVRVMAGFMDQVRIDGMARELTDAILEADGSKGDGSGPRLLCILEENPSGTWSIHGSTMTNVIIVQQPYIHQTPNVALEQ